MTIGGRITFPSVTLGQVVNLSFDFISNLAVGETISTQSVAATVYSGTDASPSNLISGAATASGTIVTQAISTIAGGVLGVLYLLVATITTSAGQTLTLRGYLAIIPTST